MYFVELFGTGYEFFFKLLGNHGLAILTVSLAAGLSLEPFRRFAKRLGDRDLKRRAAFECDSEIYGKHYSGVEKYYYVRTLYRLHGYHPVQSLYALAGLLVQIPIFVIAYNFFMDYQGFSGIGFGPIQNLSKPDGLLAGVHLLPLMMTGVNLATAALMANTLKLRGAERGNRQNWQLPALALIFLAALYEAPSGMVLYWTASNVLAFLRELVSNWRAQTVRSRVDNGGDAGFGVVLGERITWIGRTVANALDHPVAALAFLAGFGLMFLWFVFIVFNPERNHFKFLLTGLMALSVLAMIYLSRISLQTRREGFCSRLPLLISFAIVSMIVVYFLYAFPKRDSGAPFNFLGWEVGYWKLGVPLFFGIALSLSANLFFVRKIIAHKILSYLFVKEVNGQQLLWAVFASSATFFLTLCLAPGVNIIASSPEEFPGRRLILPMLAATFFVGVAGVGIFIFLVRGMGLQKKVTPFVFLGFFFFSTNALAQYYFLGGDYGPMDFFVFHDPFKLKTGFPKLFGDTLLMVMLFAVCCAFVRFTSPKQWVRVQVLASAIVLASLVTPLISVMKTSEAETARQTAKGANKNELEPMYYFSKSGKNVLVIFFDRFMGGFVPEILKDRPDLKKSLSGFAWYPNTLSFYTDTLRGLPAIHGGCRYTDVEKERKKVLSWKNMKHPDVLKNVSESTEFTIGRFLRADWNTFINDPTFLGGFWNGKNEIVRNWGENSRSDSLIDNPRYREFFFKEMQIIGDLDKGESSVFKVFKQYFLPFSFFKTSPSFLRSLIYNDGLWAPSNLLNNLSRPYVNNLSLAFAWPYISSVTEKSPGNFNFATNKMTHDVYAARDNGKFVYSGIGNSEKREENKVVMDAQIPDSAIQRLGDESTAVHFFSAKEALVKASAWMDWLKENKVYDNTKIVIVSDHGFSLKNPMLDEQRHEEAGISFSAYHALLMVKDFNADGDLSTENDFMTHADVPEIVLSAIDPKAHEKYGCDKSKGFRLFTEKGNLTVHDNIFEPKNWVYSDD